MSARGSVEARNRRGDGSSPRCRAGRCSAPARPVAQTHLAVQPASAGHLEALGRGDVEISLPSTGPVWRTSSAANNEFAGSARALSEESPVDPTEATEAASATRWG